MLTRDRIAEAFDSKLRGLPLPRDRTPQGRGDIRLPAGTTIISCDNHFSSDADVFHERFPAHLKHKAPRPKITNDGTSERFIEWEIEGQSLLNDPVRRSFATFEGVPGASNMKERLGYLDTEGIEKEIVFGNGINVFLGYPDVEVREWIFRIYNEHLAELQAQAPGRFYTAGNLIYWDMAKVAESIRQVKDLGIKTISLPMSPKGPGGVPMNYCMPEMDPLWGAIAEAGLPVCFHIGEFWRDGPGAFATAVMVSLGPFRQTMGELMFGGIFDRHPALRVVFLEAEINWIPGALQTASMLYECFMPLLDPKIKRHPREYWHENMYAGFIHDPAGLAMLPTIGADRVMWSADFPHQESSYGFTWTVIEEVLAATTEDEARMILGGTAQKLFGLD